MPLNRVCDRCGAERQLLVGIHERGVPHGAEGHNVVYDYVKVFGCPGCGYGIHWRFSHDCWNDPWEEAWDMDWTRELTPADLTVLRQGLAGCPDPLADECACAAHAMLRISTDAVAGRRPSVALTDGGLPVFRPVN